MQTIQPVKRLYRRFPKIIFTQSNSILDEEFDWLPERLPLEELPQQAQHVYREEQTQCVETGQ